LPTQLVEHASLSLLKAIADAKPQREVRLFEGLVSFKNRDEESCHKSDVEAMKEVVWSAGEIGGKLCEPTPPPIIVVGNC
jgi:hypothetical protein